MRTFSLIMITCWQVLSNTIKTVSSCMLHSILVLTLMFMELTSLTRGISLKLLDGSFTAKVRRKRLLVETPGSLSRLPMISSGLILKISVPITPIPQCMTKSTSPHLLNYPFTLENLEFSIIWTHTSNMFRYLLIIWTWQLLLSKVTNPAPSLLKASSILTQNQ